MLFGMKPQHFLLVALPALLCGALLGWAFAPSASVQTATKTETPHERPARKAKAAAPATEVALERLRLRIAELERQLAEKDAPSAPEGEKAVEASTNRPPEGHRGWPRSAEEMRAHMEEMRKDNPAQFAAMTNGWAQHNIHRLERAQGKLDILASVDVSQLAPRQRALHEEYQNLIARQEELRTMAFDLMNPNVTDAQRDAARKELDEGRHRLRELANAERETLLSHTARSFGVKGNAAKEMIETVKAVYQATESWGGFGPGRGGHSGRGPGRGGPR